MINCRFLGIIGLVILLSLIFFTSPVYAGDKYFSGQPVVTAGIEGSNELLIGEKTNITVIFSNSGLIDMKFVEPGAITPDYNPTTALGLAVLMENGDTPLVIPSDSQILGDLEAGKVMTSKFSVTVPESVKAGLYQVPLNLTYQYMYTSTQTGLNDIEYSFKDEEKILYLPVKIRPTVSIGIDSVNTGDLNVGGEGHIGITVSNKGSDVAKDAIFFIQPVGSSPIVPFQNSVYGGTIQPGGRASLSYKVSVSSDADFSIQYPIKLWAEYTDYQGLPAQTEQVQLSAGFKPKVTFILVNTSNSLQSGEKGIISVKYQNTGPVTAYNSQAEINILDPFTSEDDQAYLGDIMPGETKVAQFKLKVNSGTTPKQYALDSEIRYSDINLSEYVSDPVKIPVDVIDSSSNALILPGIILIIIVIGGGFLYYRRKRQ